MQKNTSILVMIMIQKIKSIAILTIAFLLYGCNLSPGMYFETKEDRSSNQKYVYLESLDKNIEIKNINSFSSNKEAAYKIGNGDQIAITIWGLPDIFPISNINPELNLRRVDSNGNIYFPYVGILKASEKTQNELRKDLSKELSKYFTNPQLDVTIARFNSQKIYILGEVTIPSKINITDIPLSLADALGEVSGLNTNTSSGSEVFIIRKGLGKNPEIFYADLSSPAFFLDAGRFFLHNDDIIYVNAKNTTRWNRVISQFFPFSSFLNSVDNLTNN